MAFYMNFPAVSDVREKSRPPYTCTGFLGEI